jgi:hypothetical protein
VGEYSVVNTNYKSLAGIRAAKAASICQFMMAIQPNDLLAVVGEKGAYWLCRATKPSEQADAAFTSKSNHVKRRQWFAEVEFFSFTNETSDSHREYKLEAERFCVPCSAFVYEKDLAFARTAGELFYLSAETHKQICNNDELQFDSDDEGQQEEEGGEEEGEQEAGAGAGTEAEGADGD